MNLAQLIDLTRTLLIPYRSRVGPAEIRRALNHAQRQASTDLEQPQKTVLTSVAGRRVELPPDAKRSGVKALRDAGSAQQFEIVTVQEANRLYPDWHTASASAFPVVVYDPGSVGAPLSLLVAPAELGMTGQVVLTYVVEPDEMTDGSDEPFRGLLAEYHHMLGHYAAYMLTGQVVELEKYKDLRNAASAHYNDGDLFPENPLFEAHLHRARRG